MIIDITYEKMNIINEQVHMRVCLLLKLRKCVRECVRKCNIRALIRVFDVRSVLSPDIDKNFLMELISLFVRSSVLTNISIRVNAIYGGFCEAYAGLPAGFSFAAGSKIDCKIVAITRSRCRGKR